jgi:hypothetical protein
MTGDGWHQPLVQGARDRALSGAVVGAALALASLRESFAGTLTVLGCPADELVSPLAIRRGSGTASPDPARKAGRCTWTRAKSSSCPTRVRPSRSP